AANFDDRELTALDQVIKERPRNSGQTHRIGNMMRKRPCFRLGDHCLSSPLWPYAWPRARMIEDCRKQKILISRYYAFSSAFRRASTILFLASPSVRANETPCSTALADVRSNPCRRIRSSNSLVLVVSMMLANPAALSFGCLPDLSSASSKAYNTALNAGPR